MLVGQKLAFVGSGVMAEAMIKGILNRGLVPPDAVVASGPRQERGLDLRQRYGVGSTTNNVEAVGRAGVVVLSVKPQMVPKVLPELQGKIDPSAMVLSIVAGTRLRTLVNGLGHKSVARAMPNTPAQVGAAMTVWTVSPATTAEQKEQAQQILAALGDELFVEEENYLDMATALSGTGPAYVFLFMEALVDAGVHLGFSRRVAQRLVKQTILGSALFAQQSQLHPAELRNMVTSPGGTTAEALYQLEKGGVRTVLSRAVWAAYQKTKILGGEEAK